MWTNFRQAPNVSLYYMALLYMQSSEGSAGKITNLIIHPTWG